MFTYFCFTVSSQETTIQTGGSQGTSPNHGLLFIFLFDAHECVKLIYRRKETGEFDQTRVVIQQRIGVSTTDSEGVGVGIYGTTASKKENIARQHVVRYWSVLRAQQNRLLSKQHIYTYAAHSG